VSGGILSPPSDGVCPPFLSFFVLIFDSGGDVGDSEAIFRITIISVDREWALTCQKFLHIVLIIDQFCCVTKNSQTGKGSSPHDLTIAALFFLATP
jgi:hypothetical protein